MVARSLTRTYAVLERRESDAMIIRAGKSEEKAMSLKLSADRKEGKDMEEGERKCTPPRERQG